ncbi:MAG: flagella synthesis protein FlgN [Oleiphilaceae bacterium]|jgi:flagella synthesis protein FlgN
MLSAQLSQQLELIQALQLTLEEEAACLREKNFTQLSDILSKKQKSLQAIDELDKVLSTDSSQNKIKDDENLLAIKNKIESQLSTCQKINAVNGKLVELSMKSNKHLMQLMKQATGKNSVTYDQKGMLNSASLLGKDIKA